MKQLSCLSMIILFLISCGDSVRDSMIGQWETLLIDLEMPSAYGQDTVIYYQIDFRDTLDPRTDIRARSKYNNNGTFTAYYAEKDEREVGHTPGTWQVKEDRLHVQYQYDEMEVDAIYDVTVTDYGWKATSIYDWDNDGAKDDTLYMESKRLE